MVGGGTTAGVSWLLVFSGHAYSLNECKDNNFECARWAATGECLSNPQFMLQNCKKSCQKCTVA